MEYDDDEDSKFNYRKPGNDDDFSNAVNTGAYLIWLGASLGNEKGISKNRHVQLMLQTIEYDEKSAIEFDEDMRRIVSEEQSVGAYKNYNLDLSRSVLDTTKILKYSPTKLKYEKLLSCGYKIIDSIYKDEKLNKYMKSRFKGIMYISEMEEYAEDRTKDDLEKHIYSARSKRDISIIINGVYKGLNDNRPNPMVGMDIILKAAYEECKKI